MTPKVEPLRQKRSEVDDLSVGGSFAEELAAAALSIARSFAKGATMWCLSPQWPAHGRHVAVEFVHPVVVGKRALPAVFLGGPAPVGSLRLLARRGDVVLAVGQAGDTGIVDLLVRAETWGLKRLWLGAGPRPPGIHAEHVLWLDDLDPQVAARSGDIVLLYHLLWELTHVVFEHPGLLQENFERDEDLCITCSDQARVGEVRAVDGANTVEVMISGLMEFVDATLVDPLIPGDLVLVHAGVVLTTLGHEVHAQLAPGPS